MRDKLLVQYGAIREAMKTNVQSIGRLIKQAQAIHEASASVQDENIRRSLIAHTIDLKNTISALLDQTDELYDKYQEFTRTLSDDDKDS